MLLVWGAHGLCVPRLALALLGAGTAQRAAAAVSWRWAVGGHPGVMLLLDLWQQSEPLADGPGARGQHWEDSHCGCFGLGSAEAPWEAGTSIANAGDRLVLVLVYIYGARYSDYFPE